jgi:hypothetical protein
MRTRRPGNLGAPEAPTRSIVLGTLKNGGLDVHDGLRVVPDCGESPAMVADDKPEQTRTLSLCGGDRS